MAVSIRIQDFSGTPLYGYIEVIQSDGSILVDGYSFVSFNPEPYNLYRVICTLEGYESYVNTLTFPAHDLDLVVYMRETLCEPDVGSGACCYVNYYIVDDLCTGGKVFYNLVSGNSMSITFPEDSNYKDVVLEGNVIYLYPVDASVDTVYVHSSYKGQGCCCDQPGYECKETVSQSLEYDSFYLRLSLDARHLSTLCVQEGYKPFVNHHTLSYYYNDFLYLKKGVPVRFTATLVDISQSLRLADTNPITGGDYYS